jgi:hypothetical protein
MVFLKSKEEVLKLNEN